MHWGSFDLRKEEWGKCFFRYKWNRYTTQYDLSGIQYIISFNWLGGKQIKTTHMFKLLSFYSNWYSHFVKVQFLKVYNIIRPVQLDVAVAKIDSHSVTHCEESMHHCYLPGYTFSLKKHHAKSIRNEKSRLF